MGHRLILVILLLIPASLWATDQAEYHVYRPAPVSSDRVTTSTPDNIFVKTVTVVGGDTLKKLARRHGGRASFFSQILLFNQITNPDLIHVGQKLRVPVKEASATLSPRKTKTAVAPKKKRAAAVRQKPVNGAGRKEANQKPSSEKVAGQTLFAQGLSSFRRGDFSRAEAVFQTFLRQYPDSPLAAEAAVHLADCYLKLDAGEQ